MNSDELLYFFSLRGRVYFSSMTKFTITGHISNIVDFAQGLQFLINA